jgi:hypothetical protein
MKPTFLPTLAALFLFSLFSCSKGNGSGNNNNNNNGKGPLGAVSAYLIKQSVVAEFDTLNEVQIDSRLCRQILRDGNFVSRRRPKHHQL